MNEGMGNSRNVQKRSNFNKESEAVPSHSKQKEYSEPDHSQYDDDDDEQYEDEGDLDSLGELTVLNSQREVAVDVGLLQKQVFDLKSIFGIENYDVGLELVSKDKMMELNQRYKGDTVLREVLTFPYHEIKTPGEMPEVHSEEDLELGDIYIAPELIEEACEVDRVSREAAYVISDGSKKQNDEKTIDGVMSNTFCFRERLPYIIMKSLLEMMGYEPGIDNNVMLSKESEVLRKYHLLSQAPYRNSRDGHFVIGVGTDICVIERVVAALTRREDRFVDRILSPCEKKVYNELKIRFQKSPNALRSWLSFAGSYIAKRFAAKEAVAKALGTGLLHLTPGGVPLKEVEIWSRPSGQPQVFLLKRARAIANRLGVVDVLLSQADERDHVVAFATAVGSTNSDGD